MERYRLRKMDKPKPRHNVSGDFGVWDSATNQWVLNAEFLNRPRARRITDALNKQK